MYLYNKKLKPNSQKLRKDMTKEERHLWYDFLKLLPATVKRQKIIGSYIVDFYISEYKLVIEIDGSQHYEEHKHKEDKERDMFLAEKGYLVRRYSNREINQEFESVCQDIINYIDKLK